MKMIDFYRKESQGHFAAVGGCWRTQGKVRAQISYQKIMFRIDNCDQFSGRLQMAGYRMMYPTLSRLNFRVRTKTNLCLSVNLTENIHSFGLPGTRALNVQLVSEI